MMGASVTELLGFTAAEVAYLGAEGRGASGIYTSTAAGGGPLEMVARYPIQLGKSADRDAVSAPHRVGLSLM
jgi:predicted amino acid dehydrogenase